MFDITQDHLIWYHHGEMREWDVFIFTFNKAILENNFTHGFLFHVACFCIFSIISLFFFLKKSWTNNESSIISKGQNPKIRISCSAHTSRKPESSLQTFTVTCQQAWMKLPAVRVAVVWHTQITAIYLSLRICEAKTKTRPPAEWSPWNKTAICCDYEAGALFKDRTCILSTCPGYRVAPVRARGRF